MQLSWSFQKAGRRIPGVGEGIVCQVNVADAAFVRQFDLGCRQQHRRKVVSQHGKSLGLIAAEVGVGV